MFKILLATKNKGKIKEIKEIFSDMDVELVELPENDDDEVEENGTSYFENALKKAKYFALKYNLTALADDSGLEIRALNGVPGIFSSRFLGKDTSYDKKNEEILHILDGVEDRRARFYCVAVLYDPKSNKYFSSEGECDGEILKEPHKKEGFGYDPIFKPNGYDKSFSELGVEIKNKISHRSKALRKMKEIIREEFLGGDIIEIKVNGKKLDLDSYMNDVFRSVILALVSTIKDTRDIEKVEITIHKGNVKE